MLIKSQQSENRGFTLIEIMVAVTIMGLLMAIAAPSYRNWVLNSEIHSVAESMQAGLQKAKTEAIRRNHPVVFNLLVDDTTWEVVDAQTLEVLDRNQDRAQVKQVSRAILPAGTTSVAFNYLGMPIKPEDGGNPLNGETPITQITLDSTVLIAAESKDLIVTVASSGNIRMCDPNAIAPSPRACN